MDRFKTNDTYFKRNKAPKVSYGWGSPDDSADLVYSKTQTSELYQFYIDDEITDASRYRNFYACATSATPNDIIEVHINSVGGDLSAATQIINSLQMTEADTVSITHFQACSAATMIALKCNRIIVMPNSVWMIHQPNFWIGGDLEKVNKEQKFMNEWLTNLMHSTYEGFLLPEEIDDLIETRTDVWMDSNEIYERLEMRNEFYKERDAIANEE